MKQLRYGHLMIMTDQDHDGSHIKGLIMNFLHHFYPSLLKVPGFLVEFITPIIKVMTPHAFACLVAAPDGLRLSWATNAAGTCACMHGHFGECDCQRLDDFSTFAIINM